MHIKHKIKFSRITKLTIMKNNNFLAIKHICMLVAKDIYSLCIFVGAHAVIKEQRPASLGGATMMQRHEDLGDSYDSDSLSAVHATLPKDKGKDSFYLMPSCIWDDQRPKKTTCLVCVLKYKLLHKQIHRLK